MIALISCTVVVFIIIGLVSAVLIGRAWQQKMELALGQAKVYPSLEERGGAVVSGIPWLPYNANMM